jgi:hypothetical protein
MIRQQVGDLLEIHFDGRYSYVVVLTKIVMFGGNIIFAYHTDGKQYELTRLLLEESGFNVCTDLRLPKREGVVTRMYRFEDVSPFWRTKLAKGTNEYRRGVRAKEWYIYKLSHLSEHVDRVATLKPEYAEAMDRSCKSFDLVVELIQRRYTPDQNDHI